MFKKFITVLLTGAMIVSYSALTTSCKDYDDDIDALNERLDNLETVTLASVQSQITSIQSSITSLQSELSSSVSSLTNQIESVSDDVDDLESSLNSQLTSLESTLKAYVDGEIDDVEEALSTLEASLSNYYTKDDLQTYLNTLLLNYYTKAQIDTMFTTASAAVSDEITARQAAVAGIQSQIDALTAEIGTLQAEIDAAGSSDVSALEAAIAENEAAIEALEADVAANKEAIATLEASLTEFGEELNSFLNGADEWFGEQFATYIANYVSYETLVEYVTAAFEDLYQEILDDLADEESDYYKAVLAIVKTQTDPIQVQLDALEAEYNEFVKATNATLDKYESRLDNLEKRIQSFVYVPATTDGTVTYNSGEYITNGTNTLSLVATSTTAEVRFRVTPDTLATYIAGKSDGWTYDIKSSEATVKASDYLTIDSCTAEVDEDGNATGYLTFKVSSSYPFSDPSTTLMFAICVDNEAAGVSYASEFIEIEMVYGGGDVSSNFVLGYISIIYSDSPVTVNFYSGDGDQTNTLDATSSQNTFWDFIGANGYFYKYDDTYYYLYGSGNLDSAKDTFGWAYSLETTYSAEITSAPSGLTSEAAATDDNPADYYLDDNLVLQITPAGVNKLTTGYTYQFVMTATYSIVVDGTTYLSRTYTYTLNLRVGTQKS